MAGSVLAKVCVPENIVRQTPFSTVYQAMLNLNSNTQIYEIEHIGIPFDEKREYYIRKRYNMDDAKLKKFYTALRKNISNGINLVNSISKSDDERMRKSIVPYLHQDRVDREDGGLDIYLVSDVVPRYLDTVPDQVTLDQFAGMCIRLCGAMKALAAKGFHIGVIDLTTLAFSSTVMLTSFTYSRKDGNHFPYPAVCPFNTPEDILKGKAPTEFTDSTSLTMLIISILNGSFGSRKPDTNTIPDDLPPDVIDALQKGRAGLLNLKDAQLMVTGLRKLVPDAGKTMLKIVPEPPYDPNRVKLPEKQKPAEKPQENSVPHDNPPPSEEKPAAQPQPVEESIQKPEPAQPENSATPEPSADEDPTLQMDQDEPPLTEEIEFFDEDVEIFESQTEEVLNFDESFECVMFEKPILVGRDKKRRARKQ